MLKDLERTTYPLHIAGREYRIRYSLNSRLCLEQCHKPLDDMLLIRPQDWTIDDVLQLIRAGLVDLPINKKAVIGRAWANIKPSLADIGAALDDKSLLTVKIELIKALSGSYPEPVMGVDTSDFDEGRSELDYQKLRTWYVDILHRPNAEFWTSTTREIFDRIDSYLVVKGMKSTPVEVSEFDD